MSSILVLDDLKVAFGEDLYNEDVTEISVNKPEEYFIALKGTRDMVRKENPKLTYALLKDLAQNIATNSHQEISNKNPYCLLKLSHQIMRVYSTVSRSCTTLL